MVSSLLVAPEPYDYAWLLVKWKLFAYSLSLRRLLSRVHRYCGCTFISD